MQGTSGFVAPHCRPTWQLSSFPLKMHRTKMADAGGVRVIRTAAEATALAAALRDKRAWPAPTLFRRGASPWLPAGAFDPATLEARCGACAALRDLRVEAQTSARGVFSGDEAARRDVDVRLASILSLAAARGRADHWLRAATARAFYVAQAPLLRRAGGVLTAAPLAALLGDAAPPTPPPFAAHDVALHLWLSPGATVAAPHYDDDHNVLAVLHGAKTVRLLSPAAGAAALDPLPPWAAAPHHCRAAAAFPDDAPAVALRAGEALLIPAGWPVRRRLSLSPEIATSTPGTTGSRRTPRQSP